MEESEDLARWKAAETLGRLGQDAIEAVPALLTAMQREDTVGLRQPCPCLVADQSSRRPVVQAIVDLIEDVSAPAREIQVGSLYKNDEYYYRKTSYRILAMIGPKAQAAVPALIAGLTDDQLLSSDDRAECAEALGEIGPAAAVAVPALTRCFAAYAWDENVAISAAAALGSLGPAAADAVAELAHALDDNFAHANVKLEAARALQKIGPRSRPAATVLAKSLKHRDDWVRQNAAAALVRIGTDAKPVAPTLREMLSCEKTEIRPYAAVALLKICPGDPEALSVLIACLQDKTIELRAQSAVAAAVLGPAGGPAVPALIKALEDRNDFVREWVADALGRIGEPAQDAVPNLTKALSDKTVGVRRYGAESLGRLGGLARSSEAALVAHKHDPSPDVRIQVVLALHKITGDSAGVPMLIEILGAEDPYGMFKDAKTKASPQERLDALQSALRSRAQLRSTVTDSLAIFGGAARSAIPALECLMRDEDFSSVPRSAARALRSIDRSP